MSSPAEKYIDVIHSWLERRSINSYNQSISKSVHIASYKGNKRSDNQDRVAFLEIKNQAATGANFRAAILLDGMGGLSDGGAAATLALSSFITYLTFGHEVGGLKHLVWQAAQFANQKVFQVYRGHSGTTLCAVLFGGQGAVSLNIGDSRIYQQSPDNLLVQISKDDTLQAILGSRRLTREPWKYPDEIDNRLSQFIGMEAPVEPHLAILKYQGVADYSKTILTSDGAHFIGDNILEHLMRQHYDSDVLCERALTLSEWMGVADNASIIILPSRPTYEEIAALEVDHDHTHLILHTGTQSFELMFRKDMNDRTPYLYSAASSVALKAAQDALFTIATSSNSSNPVPQKKRVAAKKNVSLNEPRKAKKTKPKSAVKINHELMFNLNPNKKS